MIEIYYNIIIRVYKSMPYCNKSLLKHKYYFTVIKKYNCYNNIREYIILYIYYYIMSLS